MSKDQCWILVGGCGLVGERAKSEEPTTVYLSVPTVEVCIINTTSVLLKYLLIHNGRFK